MNDWRKPCEHGRYEMHEFEPEGLKVWPVGSFCPGGSPVTAADLEGEKVWWCGWAKELYLVFNFCPTREEGDHSSCGWRLLIPIPDSQPATT